MNDCRYSEDEMAERLRQRTESASQIDLLTAHAVWAFEQVLDPYGDFDLSPEERQVGRCYWLFDGDEGSWVTEHDVRLSHPEVSDADWAEIMRAALRREAEVKPRHPSSRRFDATVDQALGYGPEGYPNR